MVRCHSYMFAKFRIPVIADTAVTRDLLSTEACCRPSCIAIAAIRMHRFGGIGEAPHRFDIQYIFGPHRSTSYYAACCYRPSSVVCRSIWHRTVVSPAKTAEQIEMPFGLCTRMGPRNVLQLTWGCALSPPGEYD